MIGTGTLVNAAAIIAGCSVGLILKNGLSERFEKIIFSAVGISVILIGIMGVIQNQGNTMMLVLSLVLGGLLGEALRLEDRLNSLGEAIKSKVVKPGSRQSKTFVTGFVDASVLFCVGAMAIVGSLNDGMLHDPSMLYTKAILDGVTSIVLGASLGIGVMFSAAPILIYQGLITVLAGILSGVLTDTLITNMSFVGNAIIVGIGFNFLFPKKFKTGNLFPAMFMPILLGLFIK